MPAVVRSKLRKPSSTPSGAARDPGLDGYRQQVQELAAKSQEYFDKTVLTLSGGALGISFVFLKDVIGANPVAEPNYLFACWMLWGGSATVILFSYLTSYWALKRTVRQINDGTVHLALPGGVWSRITSVLNVAGAVLFFAGLVLMVLFARANFQPMGASNGSTKSPATTPASSASAAPTSATAATSAAAPVPRGK